MAKKRSAKGSGSIYKDNEGYWNAAIKIGIYPNGRPKLKKFRATKQAEVLRRMEEYKQQTKNITADFQNSQTTLENFCYNYLVVYKSNSLKPASYARDYRTYKNYIKEYIGYYKIEQLNSNIIQTELINKMVSKGYSYSTIHKAYVLLNECLNKAVDDRIILTNPCRSVIQPSKTQNTQRNIKFLTDEEIKLFLNEANKPKYKNGLAIASIIYTGLRGGELCALKWEDVDFERKTLSVTKNITTTYDYSDENNPIRKVIEQQSTKTSNGRIIPLSKSALEIFSNIKNNRTNISKDDHIVLTDSKNKITSIDNISEAYNTIVTNAGIQGKTGIHTLRHTFASLLIRNNIDIKVVSEMLGHTTVNFTYNTYVHIIDQQKVAAINVLDNL